MNDRKYPLLNAIGFINFKWNCFIGWIHDLSAKWGVGHWTVWFYDNFTWSLPTKWQLIGGVPYHEYVARCELDTAYHQIRYYSNLAYEYQWAIIDALYPEEEPELAAEEISSERLDTSNENVGTTN